MVGRLALSDVRRPAQAADATVCLSRWIGVRVSVDGEAARNNMKTQFDAATFAQLNRVIPVVNRRGAGAPFQFVYHGLDR